MRPSTSCSPATPPCTRRSRWKPTPFANEDWEAVAEAHHRLEEVNGYDATARAGRLLHGLGFPPETHAKAVSDFSGGWRVRLNVARALMTPSDLLLLDEPTNHLDLDAVLWLEQWLLRYPGTLLVISHDREFLDNVTTHTLHLHEGRAKLYTGDYTRSSASAPNNCASSRSRSRRNRPNARTCSRSSIASRRRPARPSRRSRA
jgi:ATPase subunit of ABC transporter with duplicated ATPase domains